MKLKLFRGHDNRIIAIEPAAIGTLDVSAFPGKVVHCQHQPYWRYYTGLAGN